MTGHKILICEWREHGLNSGITLVGRQMFLRRTFLRRSTSEAHTCLKTMYGRRSKRLVREGAVDSEAVVWARELHGFSLDSTCSKPSMTGLRPFARVSHLGVRRRAGINYQQFNIYTTALCSLQIQRCLILRPVLPSIVAGRNEATTTFTNTVCFSWLGRYVLKVPNDDENYCGPEHRPC